MQNFEFAIKSHMYYNNPIFSLATFIGCPNYVYVVPICLPIDYHTLLAPITVELHPAVHTNNGKRCDAYL